MCWTEQKLGELVTLKQGFALNAKSKHYIAEKGIPLLKISDLFNNTETIFVNEQIPKQFLVYENEIIYTRTAQVGYAFMGKRGVVYNNCFKVIPDEEKIDKEFLYLWLNSEAVRAYAKTLATGTAQQDLNHGAFKSIKINLPPLKTQQKIASLLSNYDKLIENNTQRIKILESMAEELYKEWFVRLRFPGHEDVEVIDGVPEGWERVKLSSFGKIITGKTPSTKNIENFNGSIPFVKTPDFKQGIYLIDTDETLSQSGADSQKNQYINKNSICVSCIGTIGEIGITTKLSQTNQQINSIELNNEKYLEYLYMTIKYLKPLLDAFASSGATMGNLSKTKFSNMKVIKPSKYILEKYHFFVKEMYEEIKLLQQKNQTLKQTRDLLLPRLMSGKLNVEDLDII